MKRTDLYNGETPFGKLIVTIGVETLEDYQILSITKDKGHVELNADVDCEELLEQLHLADKDMVVDYFVQKYNNDQYAYEKIVDEIEKMGIDIETSQTSSDDDDTIMTNL